LQKKYALLIFDNNISSMEFTMKKALLSILTLLLAAVFAAAPSFGGILVQDVRGSVAFKTTGQWQPLKSGMALQEGTKISTGVNSSAVIMLDNHTLTVKPLTMIKIYENSTTKNDSRTLIGLRRGTIRTNVSRSKRVKTVFRVSTPVATSSVRGTDDEISYGPSKGMKTIMFRGVSECQSKNGPTRVMRGALVFQQKIYESLPENVLANLRDKSLVYLYNPRSTGDEKKSFIYFGTDLLNNPRSSVDTFDSQMKSSQVNMQLSWPVP
jgi:hypothetical protein